MPTATPFTALGKGNGYYRCMPKYNVQDRGDGYPADDYKLLDLDEVMHLFWNIASASITASCPRDGGGTLRAEVTSSDILKEPYERVCGNDSFQEYFNDGFSSVRANLFTPTIFRLYDGDESDEENFIGYTVDAFAEAHAGYGTHQRKWIYYTGLSEYNDYTTLTDVTVGGVTLFKYELTSNTSGNPMVASASITGTDFYTY